MTKVNTPKSLTFDFGRAISQLFKQPGGRNFAIRLVLWSSVFVAICFAICAKAYFSWFAIILEASWTTQQNPDDISEIMNAYAGIGKLMPVMMISYLGMWAVMASAETALHKRILKDVDHGFIPLRFGKDELRVMGVQFMVYLMVMGVMIVGMLGLTLLGVITVITANVAVVLAIIFGIILFAVYIGMFVYMAYFSIRMAPGAALSIQNDKAMITGGWRITHKRALNLFLAYLILYVIGYAVMMIVQLSVMSLIISENYMALMMGMSEEDPRVIFEQIADKMKSPAIVVGLVIGGIVYVIAMMTWWLSIVGVGTYAVQWWDEDQAVQHF